MKDIKDELLQYFAEELEGRMKKAKTETDVRVNASPIFEHILEKLGKDKTINNEVFFISGFADAMFSNIIVEYKEYNYFKTPKGIKEAIYGRNERDLGLRDYLIEHALNNADSIESFEKWLLNQAGIGFDGKKFIFVRFIPDRQNTKELNIKKLEEDNKPKWLTSTLRLNVKLEKTVVDNIHTAIKRLIFYLRSTEKLGLSANNLVERFGAKSDCTQKHIPNLYNTLENILTKKGNSHVKTLYEEWDRLFGIIYGEEDTDFVQVEAVMKDTYNIPKERDINSKMFMFSVSTYYNLILKILVSNLFSSLINPLTTQKEDVLTYDSDKLQEYIRNIVSGQYFRELNVENFYEIQFFEWYLYAWNDSIDELVREILLIMDDFETTTSIIKPENIGDMVRDTYQNLIPGEIRHLLGEYYTPDWLVTHVINQIGYNGELGKKVLDPTCGTGVFLTEVIKRKFNYNKDIENETIIKDILNTLVGFDINPIAVTSAKTNFLLALGDILQIDESISIPIYLSDSVLTPTVHAKQKQEQENNNSFKIDTTVKEFKVPAVGNRETIDRFFDLIEKATYLGFSDEEFVELIEKEGIEANDLALELFNEIRELHSKGKNGFWPSLLKNFFAPIYNEDKFDYVVGNPPWISWKSISDTYRKKTVDIWNSYEIFEKDAYDKITTHDDFAMAVTYVAIDHYLKQNGKLGFVLSKTFFKSSKGGEGFRKFRITRNDLDVPFKVTRLDDMEEIRPFDASNRTSTAIMKKGEEMEYPLRNYIVWSGEKPKMDDPLIEVRRKTDRINLAAVPINSDHRSPWLTVDSSMLPHLEGILGESNYNGRKGIEPCGAKGIYVLHEPQRISSTKVKIRNNIKRSRLKKAKELGEIEGIVSDDLIFPAIGGRNIDRWGINSNFYMIVPHDLESESPYRGIPESELKVKYPDTFEWLYYFHDLLLETRIRNGKYFDKDKFPFYRLDNVGPYTNKPYKVVWGEQKKEMTACVVSKKEEGILEGKLILTDSKCLSCHLDDLEEAYFLCGILNSNIVSYIIENYTIDVQIGIDVLDNIKIPMYNPENDIHVKIKDLSKKAHEEYKKGESEVVTETEEKINEVIAEDLYKVNYLPIKNFIEQTDL